MDRAERTGLAIALVGHGALFTALTIGLSTPPELPKIVTPPVEVTLTSDIAAQSSSPAHAEPTPPAPPTPRSEAPAQPPEPLAAPPPPVAAPPMRPRPLPPVDAAPAAPAPRPKPTPKAEANPTPPPRAKASQQRSKTEVAKVKPVAAEPTERRRPGLSKSIVTGLTDQDASEAPAKAQAKVAPKSAAAPSAQPATVPAAQMTGAQKASLNSLIFTQLKPHWRPPSGADAELLVTQLSVRLNRDGSLAADPEVIIQRGINDSNRAQARLHADRAIQAVRRAAPFTLPTQFYDGWKWLNPLTFDGRLSR